MKEFEILSPIEREMFPAGSIIESTGTHSLDLTIPVWVVLQDIFGHYYLQNPPVALDVDGKWHARNIHLGHDITTIVFVRVTTSGNEVFLKKVKYNDWGAFDEFPPGTEEIGSVIIRM
jgi:hypothetical protein